MIFLLQKRRKTLTWKRNCYSNISVSQHLNKNIFKAENTLETFGLFNQWERPVTFSSDPYINVSSYILRLFHINTETLKINILYLQWGKQIKTKRHCMHKGCWWEAGPYWCWLMFQGWGMLCWILLGLLSPLLIIWSWWPCGCCLVTLQQELVSPL